MIGRVWQTGFDRDRHGDLARFANDISLPMLRSRTGNRGVYFLSRDDTWITLTLWSHPDAVARLDHDPEYQQVAAQIQALGVLRGAPTTQTFRIEGMATGIASRCARPVMVPPCRTTAPAPGARRPRCGGG